MERMIPIQSGNAKYIGLTIPEWALALLLMPPYLIFTSGKLFWICVVLHVIGIIVYGLVVSKLEENIIIVLIENKKIDNVIKGTIKNPIPISQPVHTTPLFNFDADQK